MCLRCSASVVLLFTYLLTLLFQLNHHAVRERTDHQLAVLDVKWHVHTHSVLVVGLFPYGDAVAVSRQ